MNRDIKMFEAGNKESQKKPNRLLHALALKPSPKVSKGGPVSVAESKRDGSLYPSAPPPYESWGTSIDTTDVSANYDNVEAAYYLRIIYNKGTDPDELIDAARNLYDEFVGDVFIKEMLAYLIPSSIRHLTMPGSRWTKDRNGKEEASVTVEAPMSGFGLFKKKPDKRGGAYSRSHSWITKSNGRCEFDISLSYKPTRTKGRKIITRENLFAGI